MKDRIQKGEFVDLEKLLPKEKGNYLSADDGLSLEVVTKDGHAFLAPQREEKRINGIRRWDQAFRVYTTIFTHANPERASEIWQHVHVIHTATTTYNWANVSLYDFMFRQLMASKPWRSWAKTDNQGWNLALREPAIRAGGMGNTATSNYAPNNSVHGFTNTTKPKTWRDDCCWHFNKNQCKEGNSCKWNDCCTYCGRWNSHGYHNCKKRLSKSSGGDKVPDSIDGKTTTTNKAN